MLAGNGTTVLAANLVGATYDPTTTTLTVSVSSIRADPAGSAASVAASLSSYLTPISAAASTYATQTSLSALTSSLMPVAFSGAYTDLSGVPGLATDSTNGLMSSADKLFTDQSQESRTSATRRCF